MRRQATNWEEIFAEDISDKGLLSKIYNKVLKLNKTSNNLIIKWQKKKIKWQRFGHPTKEDIPMATCI